MHRFPNLVDAFTDVAAVASICSWHELVGEGLPCEAQAEVFGGEDFLAAPPLCRLHLFAEAHLPRAAI